MKNIAIIGASGSIGTQTLEVLRKEKELFLVGVSVHSNLDKLKEIIIEFNPRAVAVTDEKKYEEAIDLLRELHYEGELSFG
ncbi:MAG TPA: 1-deoxy-D-xylulose-5-phosphate reductoisomerase, partial [Proteiniclasticum sp.]|nr:1-deoxy-D-xylulose-5-phosphate reductoisomerase [Proteiniclasticum sp.]